MGGMAPRPVPDRGGVEMTEQTESAAIVGPTQSRHVFGAAIVERVDRYVQPGCFQTASDELRQSMFLTWWIRGVDSHQILQQRHQVPSAQPIQRQVKGGQECHGRGVATVSPMPWRRSNAARR